MANIIKAFTIMPFAPEFNPVYSAIERAAKDASTDDSHVVVKRLDEVSGAGRISDDLVAALKGAAFCIADLTGDNPNVMWEVGYAMGMGKAVITITQSISDLPFDLKDVRTIKYDVDDLNATLIYPLLKAIRATSDACDKPPVFSTVELGSRRLDVLVSDVDGAEQRLAQAPSGTQVPSKDMVKRLAESAGLFERSFANPHLRYLDGDISYWFEQRLPVDDLRIEFLARRAVLSAADRTDIEFATQGDLSSAAQSVSKKLFRAKRT
jgi:hypothetical protein